MQPLVVFLLLLILVLIATTTFSRLFVKRRKHRATKTHHSAPNGHPRSPEWSRVEREHLLRQPQCQACGHKGSGLQVHHIKPFHLYPHLELDPHNLITLCQIEGREHHLLLGHLGNWGSYNEHVRADVKHFYKKTAKQIRADLAWQKKSGARP
jgi:hypothetical protein